MNKHTQQQMHCKDKVSANISVLHVRHFQTQVQTLTADELFLIWSLTLISVLACSHDRYELLCHNRGSKIYVLHTCFPTEI